MKKVLLVIVMLLTITANAQDWQKKVIEADALKGISETIIFEWSNGECSMTISETDNSWSLSGTAFKPDPTHLNHRNNFETYAKIGFYTDEDILTESWDNCRLELTNFYRTATSASSKKKKGQFAVSNYLKNEKGYVRIIISTIQGNDFDVTIPCMRQ